MLRRISLGILVWACAVGGTFSAQQGAPAAKLDFKRDVQPILRANCYGCHGPNQQMNNFRLDRRKDAMRGGTIPVISPGNGETSRIYLRLTGPAAGPPMPPTGPLNRQQIDTIKAWIDQGAEWPDDASGEVPPMPVDAKATALADALRRGDRGAFEKGMASAGAAVNLRAPGGITPLMAAALYGDAASLKRLLDAGADPNLKNEAGATALMWAVPDVDKTRLLVDRGADVNAKSDDGRTPLMIAAGVSGSSPAVKLLLDKGAKPNAKTAGLFGDTTALLEAAYMGDEAVFQMLVDAGADLRSAGPFTLAFAGRARCAKCIELLMAAAPKDVVAATAMIVSPPLGDSSAVKAFLDQGVPADMKDPAGRTMLMLAAASDSLPTETVKALIVRGSDVNAAGPNGVTALSLARQRGQTAVVDLLVKAGATTNQSPSAAPKPSPAGSVREAVARTLPVLQKSDEIFFKKAGCVSCHNNTITAMSVAAARKIGVPVNEQIAANQKKTIGAYVESWRERLIQGIGIPGDADTVSYIALGLAAENYPADAGTDAMARYLKSKQFPDGRWRILAHRPPIESSDIEVTAVSMRSLQLYAPAAQRAEYEKAIGRAATWIAAARPESNEDRVFRLLALGWSNAPKDVIQRAARDLAAGQQKDGGWAQLATLSSDAYATGQALYALRESGAVQTNDAVFRRGAQFLIDSQLADGSWLVRTRAIPLQPHFESGFPHGYDQFISAAASNWAVLALTHAASSRTISH